MNRPKYKLELIWESPPEKLDISILKLNGTVSGLSGFPIVKDFVLFSTPKQSRIYIIGHPEGKELAYSLQNSQLQGYAKESILYHTPTSYGSSGSPLFNENWELVGIHRGYQKKSIQKNKNCKQCLINKGIPISAIIEAIKND
jgi:hypothetical protein